LIDFPSSKGKPGIIPLLLEGDYTYAMIKRWYALMYLNKPTPINLWFPPIDVLALSRMF
tara:strand:- start:261 stop:437 length:177 start_codon:yes stop_codon:yes gene_type:complete